MFDLFKRKKIKILGEEGIFTAGCKVDEDGSTMTCTPKFDTGKHVYTGERPIKLKVDNDIIILDDGGTPEPLLEKTIRMIEKMRVR